MKSMCIKTNAVLSGNQFSQSFMYVWNSTRKGLFLKGMISAMISALSACDI
jgi:hypothetical protein